MEGDCWCEGSGYEVGCNSLECLESEDLWIHVCWECEVWVLGCELGVRRGFDARVSQGNGNATDLAELRSARASWAIVFWN